VIIEAVIIEALIIEAVIIEAPGHRLSKLWMAWRIHVTVLL
jgi:hypothetical protein